MKLISKMALVLLLTMCLALVVYVYVGVRITIRDFEEDTQHDQEVMARAVAAAVTSIWQVRTEQSALEVVRLANEREQDMEIRWVDLAAADSTEHAPNDRVAAMKAQASPGQTVHARGWRDGKSAFYSYRALPADGRSYGAIEISESLDKEAAIIRGRIMRSGVMALALVLAAVAISFVLDARFVGGPVERLVRMARRVGEGDFAARVTPTQRDEIGELTVEMNVMADRLCQLMGQLRHADRLTTVGKLASGVAHELGTPLHVIGGRAKGIANEPGISEKVAKSANTISAQVEKISTIVRQLLDFARGPVLKRVSLDLSDTLRDTISLLAPIAAKKDISLEIDAGSALWARVDRVQLQQVLTNLAVNAIHASPAGAKVTLGGQALTAKPVGANAVDGCYIRLYVEDCGSGVPDDVLPHIFEPFFTTKEVGEGTGLGLSVSYSIVREHKGWIDVDTQPGRGTCFSVYLPAETS